jgi:hypothetical protein
VNESRSTCRCKKSIDKKNQARNKFAGAAGLKRAILHRCCNPAKTGFQAIEAQANGAKSEESYGTQVVRASLLVSDWVSIPLALTLRPSVMARTLQIIGNKSAKQKFS